MASPACEMSISCALLSAVLWKTHIIVQFILIVLAVDSDDLATVAASLKPTSNNQFFRMYWTL